MASYFDLPPQQKKAAANIDALPPDERKTWGKSSLLSPQVSNILEGLDDDASSSDEHSLSEKEEQALTSSGSKQSPAKKEQKTDIASKGSHVLKKSSIGEDPSHVRLTPPRSGASAKPKQPHMARFHSLRSMLFSSNIEANMKNASKEECEHNDAATKWKGQHEQRQAQRSKAPEKEDASKDGLGSRIKMRIRRLTSKDASNMQSIDEDKVSDFSDQGSTASEDAEAPVVQPRPRDPDEESIDHSDIEDLVRWVSRRDPPSDGEAKRGGMMKEIGRGSDTDSLGHSDVESLVKFVSRRSMPDNTTGRRTGYSDDSIESDDADRDSEDEDADDLVRWISHRDGPKVETKSPISHQSTDSRDLTAPEEEERGRPRSRDGGLEQRPGSSSRRPHATDSPSRFSRRGSIHRSSTPTPLAQDARASRIRDEQVAKEQAVGMSTDARSLSHSDIADLVVHVRHDQENVQPSGDPEVPVLKAQEKRKEEAIGMTVEDGSLSHADVQGLVDYVRKNSQSEAPITTDAEAKRVKQDEKTKEEALGMTVGDASLSHSDLKQLVEHVQQANVQPPDDVIPQSSTMPIPI